MLFNFAQKSKKKNQKKKKTTASNFTRKFSSYFSIMILLFLVTAVEEFNKFLDNDVSIIDFIKLIKDEVCQGVHS